MQKEYILSSPISKKYVAMLVGDYIKFITEDKDFESLYKYYSEKFLFLIDVGKVRIIESDSIDDLYSDLAMLTSEGKVSHRSNVIMLVEKVQEEVVVEEQKRAETQEQVEVQAQEEQAETQEQVEAQEAQEAQVTAKRARRTKKNDESSD